MAALTTELDHVRDQLKQALHERDKLLAQEQLILPDLEAIRDHILKDLKLGKQAPGHKAAVKVLDRFIAELRSPN